LQEIAKRARRTPRIANRLLKRVRDYAQVKADGTVTPTLAVEALSKLDIDQHGLDELDRKILNTIVDKFGGGPVGLNTIAAVISEDQATLEEVYEPYLIQSGFLARTSRGRVVTEAGYKHIKKSPPKDLQRKLV